MAIDILSTNGLTNITGMIAAVAALGTAAAGMVDLLKTLPGGGVSHIGYSIIKLRLKPVAAAFAAIGELHPWDTLHANWINGVASDRQKAIAKSLVHLGLTPANAPGMATAMGIDPAALSAAVANIQKGSALTSQDTNVLGRFDTMVSAILDAGYEKADQKYRNCAKLCAAVIAVLLSLGTAHELGETNLWLAFAVGLVSTPLAPMAKDLTSSIQAAAGAVSSVKKV